MAGGKALYFDDNHLSKHGSRYLTPLFSSIFTGPAAGATPALAALRH